MALQIAHQRGFTLIELMVATVITMVTMLALLMAIVTSMRTNLENDLRNAAVRMTNQTAEALIALPINDAELADGPHARSTASVAQNEKGFPAVLQSIRGFRQAYAIHWTVASLTKNVKQVSIIVSYGYRKQTFTNESLVYKHASL